MADMDQTGGLMLDPATMQKLTDPKIPQAQREALMRLYGMEPAPQVMPGAQAQKAKAIGRILRSAP